MFGFQPIEHRRLLRVRVCLWVVYSWWPLFANYISSIVSISWEPIPRHLFAPFRCMRFRRASLRGLIPLPIPLVVQSVSISQSHPAPLFHPRPLRIITTKIASPRRRPSKRRLRNLTVYNPFEPSLHFRHVPIRLTNTLSLSLAAHEILPIHLASSS